MIFDRLKEIKQLANNFELNESLCKKQKKIIISVKFYFILHFKEIYTEESC